MPDTQLRCIIQSHTSCYKVFMLSTFTAPIWLTCLLPVRQVWTCICLLDSVKVFLHWMLASIVLAWGSRETDSFESEIQPTKSTTGFALSYWAKRVMNPNWSPGMPQVTPRIGICRGTATSISQARRFVKSRPVCLSFEQERKRAEYLDGSKDCSLKEARDWIADHFAFACFS